MRDEQVKEKFSDITLLKKPQLLKIKDTAKKQKTSVQSDAQTGDCIEFKTIKEEPKSEDNNFTLVQKPETVGVNPESRHEKLSMQKVKVPNEVEEKGPKEVSEHTSCASATANNFIESKHGSTEAKQKDHIIGIEQHEQSCLWKLHYMETQKDQSVEETSKSTTEEAVLMEPDAYRNAVSDNTINAVTPVEKSEDADWTRVEDLDRTGDRGDVELIGSSTRGVFWFFDRISAIPQSWGQVEVLGF
ncbi:30S ribosomal protein S1 [Quillaja saponaria]|uniref:30S ribosomal protein S1 n=1 Tax=Quillaja saponaria TaxID=32244 RepID=A0AAD7P7E9_QUISA|nr:30S ribosomal protein S1 [Quillaja saponaria]